MSGYWAGFSRGFGRLLWAVVPRLVDVGMHSAHHLSILLTVSDKRCH